MHAVLKPSEGKQNHWSGIWRLYSLTLSRLLCTSSTNPSYAAILSSTSRVRILGSNVETTITAPLRYADFETALRHHSVVHFAGENLQRKLEKEQCLTSRFGDCCFSCSRSDRILPTLDFCSCPSSPTFMASCYIHICPI